MNILSINNEDKLLTAKEISELSGIPVYTIINNWVRKGLKHIRGKPMYFKLKWIDEFIEEISENNLIESHKNHNLKKSKVNITKNKNKMHIKLEDFI